MEKVEKIATIKKNKKKHIPVHLKLYDKVNIFYFFKNDI